MSLRLANVMRSKLVTCDLNGSLRKVSETMLKEKVLSVLVRRGEEIIGIITPSDLIRSALEKLDFDEARAKDIMSQPLDTCNVDDDLDTALNKFEETGRSRLVVKKGEKVVGVLNRTIAERFKGVTKVYNFSARARFVPFRRGRGD